MYKQPCLLGLKYLGTISVQLHFVFSFQGKDGVRENLTGQFVDFCDTVRWYKSTLLAWGGRMCIHLTVAEEWAKGTQTVLPRVVPHVKKCKLRTCLLHKEMCRLLQYLCLW